MTKRARDQRRIDPRGLQRIQYDHRFHTMFHMDFYTSVVGFINPRPLADRLSNKGSA